jgi:hypothetical protein
MYPGSHLHEGRVVEHDMRTWLRGRVLFVLRHLIH